MKPIRNKIVEANVLSKSIEREERIVPSLVLYVKSVW